MEGLFDECGYRNQDSRRRPPWVFHFGLTLRVKSRYRLVQLPPPPPSLGNPSPRESGGDTLDPGVERRGVQGRSPTTTHGPSRVPTSGSQCRVSCDWTRGVPSTALSSPDPSSSTAGTPLIHREDFSRCEERGKGYLVDRLSRAKMYFVKTTVGSKDIKMGVVNSPVYIK